MLVKKMLIIKGIPALRRAGAQGLVEYPLNKVIY